MSGVDFSQVNKSVCFFHYLRGVTGSLVSPLCCALQLVTQTNQNNNYANDDNDYGNLALLVQCNDAELA